MKLIELNPRWYVSRTGGPRVGFTFECPHCRQVRLGVAIHQDGRIDVDHADIQAGYVWKMKGDSFENLSLTPSVDASKYGHWHGFITDGEIR